MNVVIGVAIYKSYISMFNLLKISPRSFQQNESVKLEIGESDM